MVAFLGTLTSPTRPSPELGMALGSLEDRAPGRTRLGKLPGIQVASRSVGDQHLAEGPGVVCVVDGRLRFGAGPVVGSDALAQRYHARGINAFRDVTGTCALVVADARTATIHLYRDFLGTRPIYYARLGDTWLFGSEVTQLLSMGISPVVDPGGLRSVTNFRYCVGPTTLYDGVSVVPPGASVSLRCGESPVMQQLRAIVVSPEQTGDLADWVDRTHAALVANLESFSTDDAPIGIPLSGGVDSSLIAAMAQSVFKKCIAYTAAIDGYHNPELERAREVALRLGMPHRVVPVRAEDVRRLYREVVRRAQSPPRQFNGIVVAKLFETMAREVPAAIMGEAADTMFGGRARAPQERIRRRVASFSHIPMGARLLAASALLQWGTGARARRIASELMHTEEQLGYVGSDIHLASPAESSPATRQVWSQMTGGDLDAPDFARLRRVMEVPGEAIRRGYGVMAVTMPAMERNDRLASPLGLELCYPFLEGAVPSLGLSQPSGFKKDDVYTKPVLRTLLGRYLGQDVAGWSKLGFPSPEADWMGGPLREHLEAVFRPDRFLDAIVPLHMRAELTLAKDHQMLWTLMTLHTLHGLTGLTPPTAGPSPEE